LGEVLEVIDLSQLALLDDKPLWQMDIWYTQIRSVNQYDEKWLYIRQNPVRVGWLR